MSHPFSFPQYSSINLHLISCNQIHPSKNHFSFGVQAQSHLSKFTPSTLTLFIHQLSFHIILGFNHSLQILKTKKPSKPFSEGKSKSILKFNWRGLVPKTYILRLDITPKFYHKRVPFTLEITKEQVLGSS